MGCGSGGDCGCEGCGGGNRRLIDDLAPIVRVSSRERSPAVAQFEGRVPASRLPRTARMGSSRAHVGATGSAPILQLGHYGGAPPPQPQGCTPTGDGECPPGCVPYTQPNGQLGCIDQWAAIVKGISGSYPGSPDTTGAVTPKNPWDYDPNNPCMMASFGPMSQQQIEDCQKWRQDLHDKYYDSHGCLRNGQHWDDNAFFNGQQGSCVSNEASSDSNNGVTNFRPCGGVGVVHTANGCAPYCPPGQFYNPQYGVCALQCPPGTASNAYRGCEEIPTCPPGSEPTFGIEGGFSGCSPVWVTFPGTVGPKSTSGVIGRPGSPSSDKVSGYAPVDMLGGSENPPYPNNCYFNCIVENNCKSRWPPVARALCLANCRERCGRRV